MSFVTHLSSPYANRCPPSNQYQSGQPTITWEPNSACIPDGFEVWVWELGLDPNTSPPIAKRHSFAEKIPVNSPEFSPLTTAGYRFRSR